MNLFKKFLLVLCFAISVQPAYGWSWGGVASSVTNFITSSIPSFFSQVTNYASEHKTAVVLGAVGLLALTATKYAYGKYSDKIKAQEEEQRQEVEKEQRLEEEAKRKRQEAARLETERKAREELERQAEEARKAQEEADRIENELKEKRLEAERKVRREDKRLRREKDKQLRLAEFEKLKLEDEKLAQEEAERLEIEKLEAARKAREEAERKRLEEERIKKEQLEIERKLKEEADRRAREEKERLELEQKLEAERLEEKRKEEEILRLEIERLETAQKIREEEEKQKAKQLKQAQEEAERLEAAKRAEAEQKAREEKERLEAERQRRIKEEELKIERKRLKEQKETEQKIREEAKLKAQDADRKATEDEQRLAEAAKQQKAQEEKINLDLNILSGSYRNPESVKKDDTVDFVKDDLTDSAVLVKNWKHLLIDAESINNYLNSNFHIGKCLSTEKLSQLIREASDYRDLIQSGAELVWNILNTNNIKNDIKYNDTPYDLDGLNSPQEHTHRNSYLADIVRICWFMYSHALHKNKNNAFDEGSFIIHDFGGRIFNFLLNYVKKVNPRNWNSNPVGITDNAYGYCRISSHIMECQKKGYKHYGIDIRFGQKITGLKDLVFRSAVLPAGQTHILFGKVDKNRTFIKMENDGLYRLDGIIQHAGGFLTSAARKSPIVGQYIGDDDGPTYRKERVPKIFKDGAQALGLEISAIDDIFKAYKKEPNKYRDLIQKVRDKYPLDYNLGRIGNEIILDAADLDCSYFYLVEAERQHKKAIRNLICIRYLIQCFFNEDSAENKKTYAIQIQNLVKKSSGKLPAMVSLNAFICNDKNLKHILKFKVN